HHGHRLHPGRLDGENCAGRHRSNRTWVSLYRLTAAKLSSQLSVLTGTRVSPPMLALLTYPSSAPQIPGRTHSHESPWKTVAVRCRFPDWKRPARKVRSAG